MPRSGYRWVRVKALTAEDKATVGAACERSIAEVLKPRYLPEIRPTEFNYPVDIFGKWRGNRYSFITRYRSGWPESAGEEFDAPFARLDHDEEGVDQLRFHVMWFRHTGKWWCLHASLPFPEALRMVETEEILAPT